MWVEGMVFGFFSTHCRSSARATPAPRAPIQPEPRSTLLSQRLHDPDRSLAERIRDGFGRRATGIALALLVEALLVLLLITLSPSAPPPRREVAMSTFAVSSEPAPEPDPAPAARAAPATPASDAPATPPPEPLPPRPREPAPTPPPPTPIIPLSRQQMAMANVVAAPAPPPAAPARRRMMGPPAPGPSSAGGGDTPLVDGRGPNGEPLYAAAWYRRPYDNELRGYLSTARGPGWGLIACRTVANFRVEDCVGVGESPSGSNIMRAVLAAAWQFRVRPPQIGGRPQVGEWVRIRIDYEQTPK